MENARQHPLAQVLGPDDLRLASHVFEAALQSLDESARLETSPHMTRRLLAQYVIERALMGERDFVTLRDGALKHVIGVPERQG